MPSSNDAGATLADLRVRLLWLTLFRTAATTLVLVGLGAQLSSGSRSGQELGTADLASFGVIALTYVLTLLTALLLRVGRVGAGAAWVQIGFDALVASSVVFLTGGATSTFSFLFLVTIIGAALLLGARGAGVGFFSAALGYLGVLALLPSTQPHPFEIGTQLLSQLLIAVLSGYVGEQLSRAGGRLQSSERDLKSLTDLQNEIVSAIPSGLMTCGADGRITFINTAASSILGLAAADAIGVLDVERVLPSVRSLAIGRRSELRVDTPRGERTLGLSVVSLASDAGMLIVFQDLTELRRVERELAQIDHLATLGRVSAQLAHEIRNPLAAMRGSAQLLASDAAGPSVKLASVIVREADRLAGLVDGYLKLARPPPPSLTRARLDQVVLETLELFRADPSFAGVRVEQDLRPIDAECDQSQVKQALLNLLRNAASAVEASRGSIRVRVAQHDGVPCVDVWDSAGGIKEEDRHRIFEPFFTRSRGGSGLGLSTVLTIAQAHGGSVTVDSSPEKGTTFSLKLRA